MNILVTIPHFFGPSNRAQDKEKKTGSAGGNIEKRVKIVKSNIFSFMNIFGYNQGIFDIINNCVYPVNNKEIANISIVICTAKNYHLIDQMNFKDITINHVSTDSDPKYLGFVCHSIMKNYLGQFDYYCYMEDDLIIQDPFFFKKLEWFNQEIGNDYVLQPNRYELSDKGIFKKLYIDGYLPEHWIKPHKDLSQLKDIYKEFLGQKIRFYASSNPHSGCFFLNKAQFEMWSSKPFYLDGDPSFIGPLESAATLGILKCFQPYKAAPENANFFEILHGDNRYIEE
ncbi:MAG: calcium-binding protein [Nitrospira sp.]|nr:calcium-binding protein [Nitrospira sp.]